MLTRKQMNLLLQQAIHSAAYDFWLAEKEGLTWAEERHARLVLACFQKPVHVWTSAFREIVAQYQKGPTPRDPRIMMDQPPTEHDAMCKLAKLANLNIVQVADKCSDFALTQLSSASSDLKQVCRGSRQSSNQVSVMRP